MSPSRLSRATQRRRERAWLGAVLVATLFACKSDAERVRLGQVARLADHIDRLRRADNPDKRALLQTLTGIDCPDTEACALKDLCLRAYSVHQRALDEIESLQSLARQQLNPAPPDLGVRLERAQAQLVQAKALSEQCAEEQVRLMRSAMH
ncbi:MAG TPA: hypothetical protein VJU61_02525 [Polyangiaceae bacterium]|nr:hypothetical protein [Polyangiaceae bacterium]